jgi:cytochrome d ubiquinol oxidase subunit II
VHLADLPLALALAGLVFYTVLGGADFGAGLWQLASILVPARSQQARERAGRVREHAHHAMGPVWEANHVWLIFVLTVTWTAYPMAFGAIASTLAVPLFIAGLGVIFRGLTYALRAGSAKPSEQALIDTIFSISSILTPYALGAMVGAIASLRVPQGNAAGHLFSSWLNPTSTLVGVLAVAVSAYMAAVYLAADATRAHDRELADQFRARALLAGALAGGLALAGLPILHSDAHRIYARLTSGPGLPALILSMLAGLATLALVLRRRFEPARVSAALAVVGVIAGWGLAQQPLLLRHLTLHAAASPHDTLLALIVAIVMGAVILFPALGLLFSLVLRGRFDHATPSSGEAGADTDASGALPGGSERRLAGALASGLPGRLAVAALLGGAGLLTVAEAAWAHAVGVICLVAAMILGVVAIDPAGLAGAEDGSAAAGGVGGDPQVPG